MENLQHLAEQFKHYWNTIALLATWVGILIVWYRRRTEWRRKQFLNQVNFSLNYVVNNTLAMRTLLETTAQLVWLNDYGVKAVFAAAGKTTVDHPFIVLDDPKDQDFINRAVLNTLSEKFADTYLAAALGGPTRVGSFCFAITCEKYEEIRTVKLRVLIIEERTLLDLFGPGGKGGQLQLTHVVYKARLKSLQAIHDMYLKDKTSDRQVLGHMEMGVPE